MKIHFIYCHDVAKAVGGSLLEKKGLLLMFAENLPHPRGIRNAFNGSMVFRPANEATDQIFSDDPGLVRMQAKSLQRGTGESAVVSLKDNNVFGCESDSVAGHKHILWLNRAIVQLKLIFFWP